MKRFIVLCLMVFGLFVFVGCDDTPNNQSISGLSYNGENIMWDPIDGATYYEIVIDGTIEDTADQATETVSYQYDSLNEDFSVNITAIIEEGSEYNPTISIDFKFLGKVENLSIESGIVQWDDIPDAEAYQIASGTEVLDILVSTNQYEIPDTGVFNLRFKPVKILDTVNENIAYYSVWSDKISGELLASPSNIEYDSELIEWDPITHATGYEVHIDENVFTVESPRLEYETSNEDFNLRIKAIGDVEEEIYDSVFSDEIHYTYFGYVQNINVTDGAVTWDPVEDADGYKLRINGVLHSAEVDTNMFDGIAPSSSTRVEILPVSDDPYTFSEWSNEIIVTILPAPIISYSDGNIIWNQVSNAAGYHVKIEKDDQVIVNAEVGSSTFVYLYDFEEVGEYEVSIKATATSGTGYYESKYSSVFDVVRLGPPENYTVQNQPLERENVMVSFDTVPYATGFDIKVDGIQVLELDDQNSFEFGVSSSSLEQAYSVEVFSVGYIDVANRLAVLGSLEPMTFNVTKLAMPTNVVISGNQVSWDGVNNTSSYIIDVDGTRYLSNNTTFTLPDLPAGDHNIKVRSMGNDTMVLSSDYSSELELLKLSKPSNLAISEGILSWDSVTGASSYTVRIGTTDFSANTTSFNLNNYLSLIAVGQGVQLSVSAVGNGSDVLDSNASDTKTLSKLSIPVVSVNNENIIWNPVKFEEQNITSYMLYIDDEQGIVVSGTSYALSNLSAGSHTITVKALGDYIETVDSPLSTSITFEKLQAPSVGTLDNQYTWDSIAGAVDYEYKFSAQDTPHYTTDTAIDVAYTTAGVYNFMIRAIGDGSTTVTSDWVEIDQQVERISTPSFTYTIDGNQVTFTASPATFSSYIFDVGTSISSTSNVYTYTNNDSVQSIIVKVKIIGGFFDEGIYYIDSNYSGEQTISFE